MLSFIRSKYREIQKSPVLIFIFFIFRNSYSFIDDTVKKVLGKKPTLYYVELCVAEHCNLNCKGCVFFSNIVDGSVFYDLDQYKADMTRLRGLFGNIRNITLLGGEPLLNDKLPEFIGESRRIFPKAKIRVVTNGLLCKKMSDELINAFKENDALLHITLYKPLFDNIEDIKDILTASGVNFLVGTPATRFMKTFNENGNSDVKKAFDRCLRKRCSYLSDGTISVCSFPVLVKWFDRQFGMTVSQSLTGNSINIYDENLDGFKLKKKLLKPISACKYCSEPEWFDWEQGNNEPKIEDYCVTARAGTGRTK
ncbi:MAG: radical SAM protein [Oscillospiraceae bacterium]|nr:radical SAM protein [Oscillospiraceae bacterium]